MKNADMPAMPQEGDLFCERIGQCPTEGVGLTKREYFAGLAMQGVAGAALLKSASNEAISGWAVRMADALLEELERPK